jgi:flavin-dependent dehydrogenase
VRLTYGAERGGPPAVGFDRSALDPLLLDHARGAGACVRTGVTVARVVLGGSSASLLIQGADLGRTLQATVVVGADGRGSVVARSAGVVGRPWLAARVGLTYHIADARPGRTTEARMVVLPGAYCGIAPVPGGRLNVGIVLASRRWRTALRERGARAVAAEIVGALPADGDADDDWRMSEPLDAVEGAAPLGIRVRRRSGPGWLLAGDAAGFIDPFTGEGLHRAFVSAELAATAVLGHLAGDPSALDGYDRAMRARFLGKDVVSLIVQGFLDRPALFDYAARRLATRARERDRLGLVIGDLAPASQALDPRFLAALLAP